jgi:hypothetical protein
MSVCKRGIDENMSFPFLRSLWLQHGGATLSIIQSKSEQERESFSQQVHNEID